MKAGVFLSVAALCVSAAAAAAAPVISTRFPTRVLAAHNAWRAYAGVPPLIWDDGLATGAAAWAQHMAMTGIFEHSNRTARPGIGENLWSGTRGAYSPEAMVNLWGSERRNFLPGVFPNVSRTGNWFDVSHYTQVIWPTTQRVGCAVASSRTADYLVCRYSPKGNVDNKGVGHPAPRPR